MKMAATASQFYFRFRFFGEISQSMAEILLLPVSENKSPPCWNFTSGSDFYICFTFGMSFYICLPNFVQIGPSATELRRHIHFLRWRPRHRNSTSGFGFSWFLSSGKIEIYQHTKFRRDISIHGWDITTSGFWKQTSAMLEFYYRFRFLRLRYHRRATFYLSTKFRPNRTIHDRLMTSYSFFKMAAFFGENGVTL